MDNAFKWIEKNGGLTTEKDYPYTSGQGMEPACKSKGKPNAADVKSITDVKRGDPKALMTAVAQQPVAIAIEADQQAFHFYKTGIIGMYICLCVYVCMCMYVCVCMYM